MSVTFDPAGTPLLVAGMHRSGTSLAASLLEACGWNSGLRMMAPSAHNPHGYHEDADLVALQGRMLRMATRDGQGGWPDWGFVEGQRFNRAGLEAFKDEALHLLCERARPATLWGWKDPRTTLLLDFWRDLLPTARYCFVYRDPWEVVRSVKRLGSDTLSRNPAVVLDIWRMYNNALIAFQRAHPDQCVLIGIQRLIEALKDFPDILLTRLGVEVNPQPGWMNRVDAGLLEAPRYPDEIRDALRHPGIDETLTACMTPRIGLVRFPPTGKGSPIGLPFRLSSPVAMMGAFCQKRSPVWNAFEMCRMKSSWWMTDPDSPTVWPFWKP